MSHSFNPQKPVRMADEMDGSYAEIVELSTFRPLSNEVLVRPASQEDEGEYICMADSPPGISGSPTIHSRTIISEGSRDNRFSGLQRASSIENVNVVEYENATVTTVTVPIIANNLHSFSSTTQMLHTQSTSTSSIEESLEFVKRLEICKTRMKFFAYARYAMEAAFKEVEQVACIDFISFFMSVAIMFLGMAHLNDCKASRHIPVMMVCCGFLDSAANCISFSANLLIGKFKWCINFRDIARAIRAVSFVQRIYGMVLVYEILAPNIWAETDEYYCHLTVFWCAFGYFHVFTFVSISVFLAMLVAAGTYYCLF